MHKVLKIAKREYRQAVRTKGFIIGFLLGPVFMGGGAIVFALLKDRVDVTDKRVAVVDRSGLVAEALVDAAESRNANEIVDPETGRKVKPAYHVEIVEPNEADPDQQRLELSDRIRRGQLHAFVDVGPGILHPGPDGPSCQIAYYAKNPALDDLRDWIAGPINDRLRQLRLEEAGIDTAAVENLFDWLGAEPFGLVSADPGTGTIRQAERRNKVEALVVPLIMPMLMFILLMMGAVPLLNTVMEEKSQRIAEVMLGSVTPFEFMLGKLIGGVCVSVTAAAVYIIGGILALQYMELGQHIPYHLLPWFFAYLVTAIFMFGAIFAALGSACNDASEAQAVSLPGMLPMILPFFVQMPVVMHPHSAFATGLSLFPLLTPMLMLIRQGTPGGIPLWQPCVGLVGVALATLFFVWVGARIFRVGILMQGTPPKLGNLVRWAIRDRQ